MIGRPSRPARLILSILERSDRQPSGGRVQPPIRLNYAMGGSGDDSSSAAD